MAGGRHRVSGFWRKPLFHLAILIGADVDDYGDGERPPSDLIRCPGHDGQRPNTGGGEDEGCQVN